MDIIINSKAMRSIGHVKNIPTKQFFTRISRNTQSKSYTLSLTECVWEVRNNALWDTHQHALFYSFSFLCSTVLMLSLIWPEPTGGKSPLIRCRLVNTHGEFHFRSIQLLSKIYCVISK